MLGETVRETRIRKGLTQARLARLAGVSRRHLAALEKGANVSVLVLRKVAAVLELTEIHIGNLAIRSTGGGATVNLPLLTDTIREARAETMRTDAILARAEGIIAGETKALPAAPPDRPPKVRFPRIAPRRLDASTPAPGAIHERPEWLEVKTAGELRQGEPVDESKRDAIVVPSAMIEKGEIIFRVRGDKLRDQGINDGDLLIVQLRPKGRAASGELVIAKLGNDVFVGRWWQKHDVKALVSDGLAEVIVGRSKRGMKVVAAVNSIVRPA